MDEGLSVGTPGLGFQPGPGLLLGRAPPARGLPLLVEKGRDEEDGLSKPERLGRGRSGYDRGALGRAPLAPGLPLLVVKGRPGPGRFSAVEPSAKRAGGRLGRLSFFQAGREAGRAGGRSKLQPVGGRKF